MKFLCKLAIVALPILTATQVAQADDIFTTADQLFEQRENNRQAIAQARSAYLGLLNSLSGDQLVYAVSQLGRLAIYEGEMLLPKTARNERRAIFEQCWCAEPKVNVLGQGSCAKPGFVEKIKSANDKEHPAYHYFKGVCQGYWGEQGSLAEKLAFVKQLEEHIKKGPSSSHGLIKGSDFEGGGVYRLAAGFYSNPGAAVLALYKPEEAMVAIDKAIAAPASLGDPSNGSQYFDNHQGKVAVFIELDNKYPNAGWKQKGIDYANNILLNMTDMIDFDTFPAGRKAEFMYNYRKLQEHFKTLSGQDWNP